jgi:hypothetical protein
MVKKFPKEVDTILVTTCNNNEQRWYTATRTIDTLHTASGISADMDPNLYPPVVSWPFDKYTGHPFMTLVCKSLRNCYIVNRRCEQMIYCLARHILDYFNKNDML